MAKAPFSDVLQYLRKVCAAQAARDLSDRQLLNRFIVQHEDAAFTVLVQRHGPMVLSACQRALGDVHHAEDCLQATFMILVRRAASLRLKASLGTWLYAVAHRVASRARAQALGRRERERRVEPMSHREPLDELAWQELRGVLDEEIAKLPEKYQAPLVLCYLEGKSQEQAAKELGWPRNSLAKRMGRARELLRQRLVRRGVGLSAGALATALCEKVSGAPVGAMLVIKTVKAAASIAAGKAAAAGCLSAQAITLAEEAVAGMLTVKVKVLVLVLALGLALGGAGLAGYGALSEKQQPAKVDKPQAIQTKSDVAQKDAPAATDLYGDPLPEGAAARLGTGRFRHHRMVTMAVAPNGKVVASGGEGLRLWDAKSGRLLRQIATMGTVWSLAFSPDSQTIFTNNWTMLDVATGRQLFQLEGPGAGVRVCAAYSPDGHLVASSANALQGPGRVLIWDAASGKELRRLQGHTSELTAIAFAPDSRTVVTASEDKTVRLWEVATGKEVRRFEGHQTAVCSAVIAPDGIVLASATDEGTIRLWDSKTGKLLHRRDTKEKMLAPLAFSPNGKILASASGNQSGTIRLWDPVSGAELRRWTAGLGRIEALAFSLDGKVLYSASRMESAISKWDPNTGKEMNQQGVHRSEAEIVRFAPSGKTLFSVGFDKRAVAWDVQTMQMRKLLIDGLFDLADENQAWRLMDLSPDGKIMIQVNEAGAKKAFRLWNPIDGKAIGALTGNPEWVRACRFSPDGKILAAAGQGGVRVWDVATGKALHQLQPGVNSPTVGFSPDGKVLASGGFDNTVRLWDAVTGKEMRRWEYKEANYIYALVFAPDGKSLAAAGLQNGVQIWATDTGKELRHFQFPNTMSRSLAWSPSGRVVAAATTEDRYDPKTGIEDFICTLHLLETYSGQEIRKFDANQGDVAFLAFSPDGRLLASGGGDSTILLWDVTGKATASNLIPAVWTAKEFNALWSDLAADASKADRAIWSLASAPKQSIPLLMEHLKPVAPAPAGKLTKLVNDLDSDQFAVRQQAAKALNELGDAAEAALRKNLEGKITLEVRRRIGQILEKQNNYVLRQLRAIDALEQTGVPEARQILLTLANGTPNPRVAEAASAALQRLAK